MAARLGDLAGKDPVGDQLLAVDLAGEIVLETGREAVHGLRRDVLDALQQGRGAAPADLDAAEQVGLRARHLEQAARIEPVLAEDLGIGMEAHLRAAPVLHPPDRLDRPLRVAAGEGLAVEGLVAGDLDLEHVREGVHHRDADAVQAAGGLVDLRIELTPGMQRGHNDLERRLAGEFRMRVDRDAAAVIGHDEAAALLQFDLDEAGMARHRLVHRVVDHLGEEVVERLLVGAADIHAGPAPHRLQPLQHLDRRGVVAGLRRVHGRGHGDGLRALHRLRLQRIRRRLRLWRRPGRLAARAEQVSCGLAHATASRWGKGSGSIRGHPFPIPEQTRNKKGL